MVVFVFVGIEMVGLIVGEICDFNIDIFKVINILLIWIGFFYIGLMIVIMVVYLWNKIIMILSFFV